MPFVLDNSVAMAWCFDDEGSEYARRVLDRLDEETALVPALWPLEVSNAIRTAERRQRLQSPDVVRFTELVRALPITIDAPDLARALGSVLNLAREYGLTTYDAAYLELAMRERIPLATLDDDLRAAARRAGVPMVGE